MTDQLKQGELAPGITLDRLTFSETAARKAIDNRVPAGLMGNAQRLADVLAKIEWAVQQRWGKGLQITSGYRCPLLNTAVGGAASSDHMKALAADLSVAGVPNLEFANWVRDYLTSSGTGYEQIILEFGRWVHVSVPQLGMVWKGECLTASRQPTTVPGKLATVYTKGFTA